MDTLAMRYEELKSEYATLWQTMTIRASRIKTVRASAKKILDNKDRYEAIQALTGAPWYFVGIIHKMEGNCDFSTHLHNGDPLTGRTKLVPRGRPKIGNPPFTWEVSAKDALEMKGVASIKDWSIERICYELERYNGFGYRNYHPNTLSPYLWSFTDHYSRGKYVSDGKWSPTAVSSQSGACALLKVLTQMDASIVLHLEGEDVSAPDIDESEVLATAKQAPVVDAVKHSRTIFAVTLAGIASIAQMIKEGIAIALDAATQLEALEPVKSVFTGLGINLEQFLFAITIGCLLMAGFSRLDDARKGRVVK